MAPGAEGLQRVDGSSGHHLRPYQQELLNPAIDDNGLGAVGSCTKLQLYLEVGSDSLAEDHPVVAAIMDDIEKTTSTDLLEALYTMTQLRHLELETSFRFQPNSDVEGTAAQRPNTAFVSNHIEALQGLTSLRLRGLPNGSKRAIVRDHPPLVQLLRALRSFTALREIELDGLQYEESHVHDLACSLNKLTGLQSLTIAYSDMSSDGSLQLAAAFRSLGRLTSLTVRSVFRRCKPAAAWYSSFAHLTSLQVLHLVHNIATPKGAQALTDSLHKLTLLKDLGVHCMRQKSVMEHAFPYAAAVSSLHRLEALGIVPFWYSSGDPVEDIVQAVSGLSMLTDLRVYWSSDPSGHTWGNKAEASSRFLAAIHEMPLHQLRTLKLGFENLVKVDGKQLAGLLDVRPSIRNVLFDGNASLDRGGADALMKVVGADAGRAAPLQATCHAKWPAISE